MFRCFVASSLRVVLVLSVHMLRLIPRELAGPIVPRTWEWENYRIFSRCCPWQSPRSADAPMVCAYAGLGIEPKSK